MKLICHMNHYYSEQHVLKYSETTHGQTNCPNEFKVAIFHFCRISNH